MVHSVADMIRCPKSIDISHKVEIEFRHWVWTPLVNSQIKVNVDGSFLGEFGRGGIFRDSKDRILVQFGREVEVDLVVHAEVLAFRESILVTVASRWASFHSFLFESDSKSVEHVLGFKSVVGLVVVS